MVSGGERHQCPPPCKTTPWPSSPCDRRLGHATYSIAGSVCQPPCLLPPTHVAVHILPSSFVSTRASYPPCVFMAEADQRKDNEGDQAPSSSDGHRQGSHGRRYANRDERDMAYLGKRQQLKRNFGFMSMLAFSCTLMITWEEMFSVFVYGLLDGGPAGLVYGYLFCWVGYFAVVASLAEMVSL